MLAHFTWIQYWTVLLTAIAIYYFFIAILFYRNEISALLRNKINHHGPGENGAGRQQGTKERKSGFDGLEPVVADIKTIMVQAGDGADKEQLLTAIHERVLRYDGIRLPAFRNAVKQYIIRNAQTICGVAVSEEELEAAWEDGPPR